MKLFAVPHYLASALFRRSRIDREMEDELRSHIQHRADDLEHSGLPRTQAERRARIEFGGYERFKEECREAVGTHFVETLFQDLRFGCRMMRTSPGFTAVAILTLAVGIAANAVVFSILNALVLRHIDLPQAQNLYMVEYGKHHFNQSYPDYVDIRDRSRGFEGVVAFAISAVGSDSGQGASRAWLYEATGNYFDVLGVQPYLGRFFHGSDEHGPDSAPYIVLSYTYWQNHFASDRSVVGRTIQLNKYPFTVLGVASPGFRGTTLIFSADLWVPLVNQAQIEGESKLDGRGRRDLFLIGRLKPGVSMGQLTGDLDSIATSLAKTYPKTDDGASFALTRPELMGDFVGKAAREFITGLMLLAGLILLAACANLGSLFASRAADRSKEVAMRLALGSSRQRIMRQLLTEATMISLAGGVVGLAGSVILLPWLSAWQPLPEYPITVPVNPDATVYAVALLLALVSGLLFGVVPVRQVLAINPYQVIKSGAIGVTRRFALRDLLLAGQIAICAVLVTASLVAVRGLVRSLHTNFGFLAQNTILLDTDLAMARYSTEQQPIIQRRILDAALAIPGATAAAYANTLPLNLDQLHSRVFTESTTDLRESKAAAQTVEYAVSPRYFDTAGTVLLAGRTFTWHDDKNAPKVAVVNQEFARQVFGSMEKAIGGHYKHRDGTRIEVVGVAEDGKYVNLTEDPQPAVFLPILQSPSSDIRLVVRWNLDPGQLTAALNRSMRDLDPGLPFTIRTWHNELDTMLFPARVATVSLGVLGGFGAMLAVTGIFGMAAYSVSKRLRELGIRIALGARREEVLGAALGRTLRILAYGSAAGLLLGMAGSKVLAFIVYQATPGDPMVLAGVVVTMLLVGLLAAWIPAQRALAANPSILLREE
jgi:macrolide transport system ATP-binding/permease protein